MLYWCFPHRCSMEGPGVQKDGVLKDGEELGATVK